MTKRLSKVLLAVLLCSTGLMQADSPASAAPAPAAAPAARASSGSETNYAGYAITATITLLSWIGKDVYELCKGLVNGEAASKERANKAKAIADEIANETNKINMVDMAQKAHIEAYACLRELYNGGNNTGLDKKDIQGQIANLWIEIKKNMQEAPLIKAAAKLRIKELEQKLAAVKAPKAPVTTIAQLQQAGITLKPVAATGIKVIPACCSYAGGGR